MGVVYSANHFIKPLNVDDDEDIRSVLVMEGEVIAALSWGSPVEAGRNIYFPLKHHMVVLGGDCKPNEVTFWWVIW